MRWDISGEENGKKHDEASRGMALLRHVIFLTSQLAVGDFAPMHSSRVNIPVGGFGQAHNQLGGRFGGGDTGSQRCGATAGNDNVAMWYRWPRSRRRDRLAVGRLNNMCLLGCCCHLRSAACGNSNNCHRNRCGGPRPHDKNRYGKPAHDAVISAHRQAHQRGGQALERSPPLLYPNVHNPC